MRGRALLAVLGCAAAAAAFAMVADVGAAPPAAAQAELRIGIELTDLAPRLVTADGPTVLTVTGEVRNDGERTIQRLDVRVQRGDLVRSEPDLRAALSGNASTDTARPRFTGLTGNLEPGATMPFRVEVPLRGGGPLDSLQITEPGVYPLLVNLNGQPDFGGRARLAAVRLLLPVLGLPAADGAPAVAGLTAAPTGPSGPTGPTPLTVLWPLIDRPHRLPTGDNTPLTLRDDTLADALAPEGRLTTLVRAALDSAPSGSQLAGAMCIAVDPDLLDTVRLMAEAGYQLPDGSPGTGRAAAAEWLREVRELVAGRCVLATPMADVDLVALSRAGLTDLQGRARTDGAQIVRDVLGISPITELVWPAGELLDERTLTDLASLGVNGVLVERGGLTDGARFSGQAVVGLATGAPATAAVRGAIVDDVTGQALAGPVPGSTPAIAPGPPVAITPSSTPSGTGAPLAAQDAMAALAFQVAGRGQAGVLLATPRRWAPSAAEATALLRTANRLLVDGRARPRDLGSLAGGGPPTETARLSYPAPAAAAEVPRSVTATAAVVRDQLRDLEAATRRDPRVGYDPARLLDPMRFGLLRGTSAAWRGDPAAATRAVQRAADQLTLLLESVRIVQQTGPYLLAASNSPLLLNLANPLAVQIDVQITLAPVAGLRTAPIDVITLPAGSSRQVRVPAEVIRAGQFSVEARLATPGGTSLGPRGASRVQLRSTAYGTVTLLVTGGAAGALVLLSALRITRRVRAARAAGSGDPGAASHGSPTGGPSGSLTDSGA